MIFICFISLPYILTTMSRYSYTSWVIIWISYGCAYTIGLMQENRTPAIVDLFKIYGSLIIGILPKQPYFFMLLFPVFMLSTTGCSDELRKKKIRLDKRNNIFALFAILFLLFSLVYPIFQNPNGLEVYSDLRGGANVSATGQLKFILMNPVRYIQYLFKNMCILLQSDCFVYGRSGFTSIGSGMGVGKMAVARDIIVFLFLWIIFSDRKERPDLYLGRMRRFFVLLLTFAGIAILCTVLYMNYSEVGTEIFSGINPFYLLTFMFPFFYYMSNEHMKSDFDWRRYNTVCYGVWMTLLFSTIFLRVVNNYVF